MKLHPLGCFAFTYLVLAAGLFWLYQSQTNFVDSAELLPFACGDTSQNSLSITLESKPTTYCLLVESDLQPIYWQMSTDESTLAFALHDKLTTHPKMSGRFGYYQPKVTIWYILDVETQRLRRFRNADNKGINLSPFGKYAIVGEGCRYDKCKSAIYLTSNGKRVCEYTTTNLYYASSDCVELHFGDGTTWDIESDLNERAQDYHSNQ